MTTAAIVRGPGGRFRRADQVDQVADQVPADQVPADPVPEIPERAAAAHPAPAAPDLAANRDPDSIDPARPWRDPRPWRLVCGRFVRP